MIGCFLALQETTPLPNEKCEAQNRMLVHVGCPVSIGEPDDVVDFASENELELLRPGKVAKNALHGIEMSRLWSVEVLRESRYHEGEVRLSHYGQVHQGAVEGRFVGYNEEAKGYRIFWAARHSISIERDIYVDKDAVLEPRDVMFEGGNLPTINAMSPEVSNPTVPNSQSNKDTPPPAEMPTVNPSSTPEMPNLKPSTTSKVRQCCNSLAGLPQFDEATYGCGKRQSGKDAVFVENVLAVNAEGILEPEEAKVEPSIMGSDWFCEAVHDAMSAIMVMRWKVMKSEKCENTSNQHQNHSA